MATSVPSGDSLYEQAACGLLLADASGTIVRANATVCEWLGHAAGELVGRLRAADLLTVGGRLFHQTHCNPILQVQGSIAQVQVEMLHRDQSRLPMLINIVRRRHDGGVFDEWALFLSAERHSYERELLAARKAAEASRDARLEAEAQLRALNQQLSAADRRKDEFLATLSHELRNPLAPMRSALEVLKLRSTGDARNEQVLAVFDRQLCHMTHLVDDLMEISRITQGRMALRRAPVDLVALVRAAAGDMRDAMAAAGHTLTVALPEAGPVIEADATRLTQVIVNLLANAAKYTPRGGQVSLRAWQEGGEAVVAVRDNGIGIPAQSLASIFEMFSQLKPALDRSQGGLGIGLALARGIVALHGGTIGASSDGPGRGSEFVVRLPVSHAMVPEQQAPAPDREPGHLRILVVDDNVDAVDTLVMALGLSGFEASAAYTALRGLEAVAELAPQVVVLDIGLPDLNGYELARRVRALPGGDALTLIAATGWGQEADKQRAFDAGFDHHLTKPIDFDQLRALLERATLTVAAAG